MSDELNRLNAELDAVASENKALREMNAKLQAELDAYKRAGIAADEGTIDCPIPIGENDPCPHPQMSCYKCYLKAYLETT
jgi:hypothetical protein